MDSGLWPQNSTFAPAGVALTPRPATGILSEQLCNGIAGKKPFHPPYIPWKSPLSLLKRGFVSLASDLQSSRTRTVPEETKQSGVCTLLLPASHSQEQRRRRMKNIWTAESTTAAAEPSPGHSTVRSSCEAQDSALPFPEILWRGSDSCRWDRGISQKKSVILETTIFMRWAKYLEN